MSDERQESGALSESDLIDLLRKFASGEGGRRSGELIRRGWLKVEVTDAGRAALDTENYKEGR